MLHDELQKEIQAIVGQDIEVKLTEPERVENGDWTTNVAFLMAKKLGNPPAGGANDVAEDLTYKLQTAASSIIDRAESVGGFINIWIKDYILIKNLDEKTKFETKKERVNLEFVSANPTGPLTMANGRGGFYGDVLANVLKKSGYEVTREYYINDAGNQVRLLGESIQAAEGKIPAAENHYKGEYVKNLKGKTAEEAIQFLLNEIKDSLKKAKIEFDVWFSEKELRDKKEPEKILKFLEEKNLIEKKDGAAWLGDAVLVKSDGEYTYFLVDLAYHWNKFFDRKFDEAINILGPDHHGYADRIKKGVAALGIDAARLKILVTQAVRAMSKGQEVKMSKRSGNFVTMDDLLEEVGLDVVRWFFLEKSLNTHMDFDLDLAKERSDKNPVYYVQYAFVRMKSILEKSGSPIKDLRLKNFGHESERNLALKILRLPEVLDATARDYQVHRLTTYAYELAQTFSTFYHDVKVVGSDREGELLYLVSKTKETLGEVLDLLGISKPEKM